MVKLKEKLIRFLAYLLVIRDFRVTILYFSPNVETIVDCSDLPEQKIPETIKSNGAVVHKLC